MKVGFNQNVMKITHEAYKMISAYPPYSRDEDFIGLSWGVNMDNFVKFMR